MSTTLEKLSEGHLTERIGSFYPKMRQGRTVNRKELSIQKRCARSLYEKREKICKSLSRSEFTNIPQVSSSALVENNLSPLVYKGWSEYLKVLSEREGGWDNLRESIRQESELLEYYRRSSLNAWLFSLAVFIYSLFLRQLSTSLFEGDIVYTISFVISCVIPIIPIIFYSSPVSGEARAKRREICGENGKDPDKFITYEKVMSIS